MADTNFGSVKVTDGYSAPVGLLPQSIQQLNFWLPGAQTVRTRASQYLAGVAGAIFDISAYIETAPTGASFIIDVMKNGVTMFTTPGNRPTILAGQNASSSNQPDIVSWTALDRIRIDVIQIGSGVAGSDLAVTVSFKRFHNS